MTTRQSLFPAPRASALPRQSYAPNALRQSLQVPSSDFLASLEDCVASTEACVSRLDGTNKAFEPGIRDLPRIKKIFDHNVVSCCLQPMCQSESKGIRAQQSADIIDLVVR